jgi:uncharacterized membrane protein
MKERNHTIDIIRGFAIITMIGSNLAGEVLVSPHPLWVSVFGSMAAPIFVLLAGYLVAMGVRSKDYKFSYFFIRGLLTVLVGAFIDSVLWGYYPFFAVDVLYLTGIAIPLTYFFIKLPNGFKFSLFLIVALCSPFLRSKLGYIEIPTMIPLFQNGKFIIPNVQFITIVKHWFIDGWFPIFSWLAVAFSGSLFYDWKSKITNFKNLDYVKIIVFSIGLALIGYFLIGIEQRYSVRNNYTEVFIPFILILFLLIEYNSKLSIYIPFRLVGVSPMFFYLFHFIIISLVILPYWGEGKEKNLPMQDYLFSYAFILILSLGCTYLIKLIKDRWKNQPFLVKFFIGG